MIFADNLRSQIKEMLPIPLKERSLTICPDYWMDSYKKISYLGVTVIFVDFEYGFKSIDLCSASIKNGNHESSDNDDNDSESSSDDECDHATALPIIKQNKFHSRKTVITTNELPVSLVKMATDQIPLCTKQVLEVLKKCKKSYQLIFIILFQVAFWAGINNDIKEDDGGIRWFRERLLKLIDELCVLDVRHYCATMLHPKHRLLKNCLQNELSQCHKYVREQLKIIRNAQ
ncbi:unnamed protein product [Adineta steineri]|uniref:Uncharacterized protein n=1 Tax=Adineta steineri TaxID=433720 RepID=A0A814NW12_9BILA|nr:unnamed protein product [Adineta steineri]